MINSANEYEPDILNTFSQHSTRNKLTMLRTDLIELMVLNQD